MKKKFLLFFLSCVTAVTALPMPSFAATKTGEVSVKSNYSSATFTIECGEEGEYYGTLTDPKGKEYELSSVNGNTLSCNINKVASGTWTISVSDDSKEEIDSIQVTVSAKKEAETDVNGNISIAKDIAGLEMYFVNDSFVVTWTDESCGNVVITLVDEDTQQTLCSEKVNKNYFSHPIPDDVQNILVTVVPSKSNGVSGAELTYTYQVPDEPLMSVDYPDYVYTNQSSVPVSVTLSDSYSLYVEVNDEFSFDTDILDAGTYSYEVPITSEGANVIQVYAVDENKNMSSIDREYFLDVLPPSLSLTEEYDGISTYDDSFTISGYVSDFDSFMINGQSVDISSDGYFSYDAALHLGNNSIVICASDLAGNVTEYSITVVKLEQEEKKSIVPLLVAFIGILLLVFYLVTIIKKRRSNDIFSEKKESIFKKTKRSFSKEDEDEEDSLEQEEEKEEDMKKEIHEQFTKKTIPSSMTGFDKLEAARKINSESRKFSRPDTKNDVKETAKKVNSQIDVKWIVKWILFVAILFIFFNGIIMVGTISSASMFPTLKVHDFAITNRLAYKVSEPQRGDIIFFKYNKDVVSKRVIGIPGDSISFVDGYVYVNGEPLDEPYLDADVETNCNTTFLVPDGTVFVLGDNRENSYDSRYWENPYISYDKIYGKCFFVFPLSTVLEE